MDDDPTDCAMPHDLAQIARFLAVGALNTLVGYGFILAGLFLGLGDYLANATGFALGMPVSWLLHRKLTFRVRRQISTGEIGRYVVAVAISYGLNLAVVTAGRMAGYLEHPFVQLAAVCCYAAVFYLLSRRFVFRAD
ncbi:MAG: GtrA family protein [Erythrobacter sp.]|nr:GtrA family protein [Erythrobacter sp.]